MCAVDGRGGFQDLRQLCGQACVAEFSLPAGEFIAILEIAELIFQLDEFGGKEQVLGGVIRNVVGDGIVPLVLLSRRESGLCIRLGVQRWSRGLAGFSCARSAALAGRCNTPIQTAVWQQCGAPSLAGTSRVSAARNRIWREYLASDAVVVGVPADNQQAGLGSGRDIRSAPSHVARIAHQSVRVMFCSVSPMGLRRVRGPLAGLEGWLAGRRQQDQ